MTPDTSAQDAPVAAQEAEARGWDVTPALEVEWARYDALPVGDSEERQLVRTRIVQLLLHAWEPSIRASERERYAALLLKLADLVEDEDFCCSGKAYEASRGYLEHSDRCPVLEARTALAALEEAESA